MEAAKSKKETQEAALKAKTKEEMEAKLGKTEEKRMAHMAETKEKLGEHLARSCILFNTPIHKAHDMESSNNEGNTQG